MHNEFIELLSIPDYINSWRLAVTHESTESFDEVLNYLNLNEFKDFDDKTLEAANSTAYIHTYLVYHRNEEGINGVVTQVIGAERYLNLMRLGVQNLSELFFKSKEDDFLITQKLKSYNDYARSKYPFESPYDKELLNNHAFNYLHNFSKVRDFLLTKSEDVLKKTAVVLSVQFEKNDY